MPKVIVISTRNLTERKKDRLMRELPKTATYCADSKTIKMYQGMPALRALMAVHLHLQFNQKFFDDNWDVISEWLIAHHEALSSKEPSKYSPNCRRNMVRNLRQFVNSVPALKALFMFMPTIT